MLEKPLNSAPLSPWVYDTVLWVISVLVDLFFREVRTRGSYRIPRRSPVIFVAAPHANQFVDPLILMRQVRIEAGRRVSILIAEVSMKRPIIGFLARAFGAIPVLRISDIAKLGEGRIYRLDDDEPNIIRGQGTRFRQIPPDHCIVLKTSNCESAEIERIESDKLMILKKPLRYVSTNALLNDKPVIYKIAPKVDQHCVYQEVFRRLDADGSIGIFPEGGSHDRTQLLPLKAGVAIMALGYLARPENKGLSIVPCGLNYFHAHKFRSRAVIEFGTPMSVPLELIEMYKNGNRKAAITGLLERISSSLASVTVSTPDFETLQVIQAGRRLFRSGRDRIPLPLIVEMNRRLVTGYALYKDDPRVVKLRNSVLAYNKQLSQLNIRDHQVDSARQNVFKTLSLLIYRSIKLALLGLLALPGSILFSPVFLATKRISRKKAKQALQASSVKIKARDVVATWKLLVALVVVPLLYTFYAILSVYLVFKNNLARSFGSLYLIYLFAISICPILSYAALRFGEVGVDIYKSLRPLYISLFSGNTIQDLKVQRDQLASEVNAVIDELGPTIFPDFGTLGERSTLPNKTLSPYYTRSISPGVSSSLGDYPEPPVLEDISLNHKGPPSLSPSTSYASFSNVKSNNNSEDTLSSTSTNGRRPCFTYGSSSMSEVKFSDTLKQRIQDSLSERMKRTLDRASRTPDNSINSTNTQGHALYVSDDEDEYDY